MPFTLPHNHGSNHTAEELHEKLQSTVKFCTVSDLFRQLSDPTRIRIFWLLCHTEECVINISAMIGISSPAVSYHLRAMKECGIIESRRDGKEVYYKIADSKECELLHLMTEKIMATACPSEKVSAFDAQAEAIKQIHSYLLENIDKRITIASLSKQFLMNSTTLKRAFKDAYGISLAAHINNHRMEKAAALLSETDLTVAQISKAVGFAGQSRFTVAFKKHFNITPVAYRKTNKRG